MALTPDRLVVVPERIDPPLSPLVKSDEPEVPLEPILELNADGPGITAPGSEPITPRSKRVGVTDPNRSAADAGELI